MCYKLRKEIHSNSNRNSLSYFTRSLRARACAKNSLDVAYFKRTVIINIYSIILMVLLIIINIIIYYH